MVVIKLQLKDTDAADPAHIGSELVLLELQGTIETGDDEMSADELLDVGKMKFSDNDIPYFTIGHHRLEGKLIKLDRPLAVIHKETAADSVNSTMIVNNDAEERAEKYEVVSLIRHKYVFKQRPEPMLAEN
ncbi:uncharacterized protein VTP21DRAFT_3180 [Calcarisporiella thermophila]|uniref:uncharacterized protein n=1 Tax=Calcarisporiella thermophila TaxID=911321 RepID=UPI00374219A7